MKAKEIAAQFIVDFGKEDPDYLTVMEVITDIDEFQDLDDDALEAKANKVISLIGRAKVSVHWGNDDSEYVF